MLLFRRLRTPLLKPSLLTPIHVPTTSTAIRTMKHRIVRKVKPSPTKLPVLNPEQVHKEALKRALSKNVATGVTFTDYKKTEPVVPEFESMNRPRMQEKIVLTLLYRKLGEEY
jgi:hypothetical protein